VAAFGSALIQDPAISIVLSRRFELDFGPPWLVRADRIESASGAATPRHTHRGPGLRRLLYGRLRAEMGDDLARINEGDAWFETGTDPIIGTNISGGNSAFVRVMVLPIELYGGKSSFVPTTAEEASKPRAVISRLFGESVLHYIRSGTLVTQTSLAKAGACLHRQHSEQLIMARVSRVS